VHPDLSGFLLSAVPETRSAEAALEAALPAWNPGPTINGTLSTLATKDMPHLRAKFLSAYLSPDAAFDWELSTKVETSALSQLANSYSHDILIEQAVRTADLRLMPLAKAAISRDVSLLLAADLDCSGWQALIIRLKGSGVIFPKGASFDRVQRQMLTLISSNALSDEVVSSLGSVGFFDLSALADQDSIWNALPAKMLLGFIEASLEGVILLLAMGQLRVDQLASQLRAQLADRVRVMGALRNLGTGRELQQLELFATLDVLTEDDFLGWYSSLMSASRSLNSSIVQRMGSLIADRRWKSAAENAANDVLTYKRNDLIPMFALIKPLLGMGQLFKLMLSGISITAYDFNTSDLWGHLEEVLMERFPGGPREHALWSRAKGSDADLLASGSGRDQWRHALRLTKENVRGSANLELLLKEAANIYPTNPSLGWLKKNWRQFAP
jgi:hypothetical protein